MKKRKYEADDGPLSAEDLAAVRELAATMLPIGKVIRQRSMLADPAEAIRARHLELAAKLRSYIPDGDGYNSDYAKTLEAAAEALESVLLRPIRSDERGRQ